MVFLERVGGRRRGAATMVSVVGTGALRQVMVMVVMVLRRLVMMRCIVMSAAAMLVQPVTGAPACVAVLR